MRRYLVYDSVASNAPRIYWTPENKCSYSETSNAALAKIEIPHCCTACFDKCCENKDKSQFNVFSNMKITSLHNVSLRYVTSFLVIYRGLFWNEKPSKLKYDSLRAMLLCMG